MPCTLHRRCGSPPVLQLLASATRTLPANFSVTTAKAEAVVPLQSHLDGNARGCSLEACAGSLYTCAGSLDRTGL